MKIEMGESLAASWLRHSKDCFLVQTNWKMLSKCPTERLDEITAITREVDSEFKLFDAEIFKENKTIAQMLRQTECDVLGMSFTPDGKAVFNAVEVAIHLTGVGLNYSGKRNGKSANVSDDKVPAKLFRIAMAVYAATGMREGALTFATPKVGEELEQEITRRLKLIEGILEKHGFVMSFRFCGNESFYKTIESVAEKVKGDVADSGELYLRAIQIHYANDSKTKGKTSAVDASSKSKKPTKGSDPLIEFNPVSKVDFKNQLLITKRAKRELFYADGRHVETIWYADAFTEGSDLMKNIKTSSFWRSRVEDGLLRVVLTIVKS